MTLMLAVTLLNVSGYRGRRPPKQLIVRLLITQRLHGSIDGMHLDRFQPGRIYDVGPLLGAVMLAEQWAEPVDDQSTVAVTPVSNIREFAAASAFPWRHRTHKRQYAMAADRPSRRKRKRKNQKGR